MRKVKTIYRFKKEDKINHQYDPILKEWVSVTNKEN